MYSWTYIEQVVFSKSAHEDVSICHEDVPDPTKNGYVLTIGEFQGQDADYEKSFTNGKRIHIRRFKDLYKIHWDFFSPIFSPIQHLRYDAPEWYVFLSTLGLAALGASCVDDQVSGAIIGGATGFVLSLLSLPGVLE